MKAGDIVWQLDIYLRESKVIRNPVVDNLHVMPIKSEFETPCFRVIAENKNKAIDEMIKCLENQKELKVIE